MAKYYGVEVDARVWRLLTDVTFARAALAAGIARRGRLFVRS